MSKASISVYTCERCKAVEEIRNSAFEYAWGELWAAQCNGPIWLGSQKKNDKTLDLCPSCMTSLKAWFNSPPDLPSEQRT